MNKYIYTSFVTLVLLASCNKANETEPEYQPVNYSGSYLGVYHGTETSGNQTSDTTYNETITIDHSNGLINVYNYNFPEDSIQDGQEYQQGDYNYYQTLKMIGDSIYFSAFNAGLGGNGFGTFSGLKQ